MTYDGGIMECPLFLICVKDKNAKDLVMVVLVFFFTLVQECFISFILDYISHFINEKRRKKVPKPHPSRKPTCILYPRICLCL